MKVGLQDSVSSKFYEKGVFRPFSLPLPPEQNSKGEIQRLYPLNNLDCLYSPGQTLVLKPYRPFMMLNGWVFSVHLRKPSDNAL